MNERIKELALQADATVLGTISGGQQYTFLEQDLKKFAELIVQECAMTLESITMPVSESYEDRDKGYNTALATGAAVIRQNFGVE